MRITVVAFSIACALIAVGFASACQASDDVVIVVGTAGADPYGDQFETWAANWASVATAGGANVHRIGPSSSPQTADREALLATLERLRPADESSPLWIILIGHGTYAQGIANFNLQGPDISAEAFAQALSDIERPLVIVNCASASGPFLQSLSAVDRVVITATRDGQEQNFAHFGEYLSEAIANPTADLDHDDRVSVLEAYLLAAEQTRAFYDQQGRLATEHPLIDDNGDGKGTPPDFFHGSRVVAESASGDSPDGRLAIRMVLSESQTAISVTPQQQQRIAEIEEAIHSLRDRKGSMETEAYYGQLEPLLLELAGIENPLTDP